MAFITTFTCSECNQQHYEAVHPSRICVSCRTAIAQAKETAHMLRLGDLPIEERVRRLERELYRLDAGRRLQALEAIHQKYA